MPLRNDENRYGAVAQAFHWLTVVLVFALVGIAMYMDDLPLGPEKIRVFNLHKSIGVTVLALTVLRLLWRQVSPKPALPAGMKQWEWMAAHIGHLLLYVLLIVQPAIGIVHSWSANFPVVVFGLFTMPNLTGPNPGLKEILEEVHSSVGWGLVGLVLVHIAAALRHHFILKDDVLRRMLPGGARRDAAG